MPPSFLAFALPVVLFLTFWALCYMPLAGVVRVVKAGAKSGAAWVARSRVGKWAIGHSGPVGSYAPILLVMVLGGIAAMGAGYLFVELAEQVRRTTSAVYRIDQVIHAWFGHERQPAMTVLLRTVTTIGGSVGLGTIERFKKQLLERRQELLKSIAQTQEEGRAMQHSYGPDEGDRANSSLDKELLFQQTTHARGLLGGIDAALTRIADGTFGQCMELLGTAPNRRSHRDHY